MKTQITEQDLINWDACYWKYNNTQEIERLRELLPCTPEQLLKYDSVSHRDKLWTLFRYEFFSVKSLKLMACDFVESILHLYEEVYPNDNRIREFLKIIHQRAKGVASDDEIQAVSHHIKATFRDTYYHNTHHALWRKARNVLRSVDKLLSQINASNIAWYVTWDVSYIKRGDEVDRINEEKKQLKIIEKYLKEMS